MLCPSCARWRPPARIIVYSGFASGIVADEVVALGAAGYLEKGAHPDTIVATIEQSLVSANALTPSPIGPA